jgi:hypothetical protein
MHQQHRQQQPLLRATERQRAVSFDHLKRPQDSEPDQRLCPRSTLAPPRYPFNAVVWRVCLPAVDRHRPRFDRHNSRFPRSDRTQRSEGASHDHCPPLSTALAPGGGAAPVSARRSR